jgi:hypothetical protein
MRTDQVIQEDVEQELRWDPDLDGINIAVSVKDGVVTLAGFVKSLTDKYEAESEAKRVAGVRAVANDLEVRLPAIDERLILTSPATLSPRTCTSSRFPPKPSSSWLGMAGSRSNRLRGWPASCPIAAGRCLSTAEALSATRSHARQRRRGISARGAPKKSG